MWFCFTSIGAVTALVIIMSLWEKFQTNPTITGKRIIENLKDKSTTEKVLVQF